MLILTNCAPADEHMIYLHNIVHRPIVLGPGQSLHDISIEDQLLRGTDWEATARHSAVITNIATGGEAADNGNTSR